MKIKGIIEDFKFFLIKKKRMIVKIYLGLSLVLLWAVWGQFIFGQFLGPAYISQDLKAPSYVVSTNYRVLIYYICHFQSGSLGFSFFCLLVSSLFDFRPDTREWWWTHFRLTCSLTLWGGSTLACAHSASATLGLPPLTGHVPSLPTLFRLQVAPLGTIQGWPWAACTSQV